MCYTDNGCRQHWFIHQYVCKKGLPYDPVTEDDGDPDWVDIETYKPSCPDEAGLEFVAWDDTKDREIYIDIPYANRYHKGEMIRLRSRTLTPEFLRWYRSLWQLPDWERVKKFGTCSCYGARTNPSTHRCDVEQSNSLSLSSAGSSRGSSAPCSTEIESAMYFCPPCTSKAEFLPVSPPIVGISR